MSRFRVSVTVEAHSAAEAISSAVIDANGEYNDRFIDIHVEPAPDHQSATWKVFGGASKEEIERAMHAGFYGVKTGPRS